MTRTSLTGLVVLFAPAFLWAGDVSAPPPAPFSAKSARVDGETLILTDLQQTDPKADRSKLAGRVLIDGDGDAKLGLFALKVGVDVQQAAPFMGREGPGGSILKTPPPMDSSPAVNFVPFYAPVRETLTDLDANGAVSRIRHVTIRTMRLESERP
ncbi:MAG TPA: hypothetical protein VMS17_23750 [Gemmataceae bacterium]|nr:hypothetical protein [Gemmataceae bacterium]